MDIIKNDFCELTTDEMNEIDGGAWYHGFLLNPIVLMQAVGCGIVYIGYKNGYDDTMCSYR